MQISHPHAIFSPDDEWVLFTSDRRGTCVVYMVEVIDEPDASILPEKEGMQ